MWRKIGRHVLALVAFLLVWGLFPHSLLLGWGLDPAWIGLLKLLVAIGVVWLIERPSGKPLSG